jgi:enoyl-CoA hydratase/carnithine racemase
MLIPIDRMTTMNKANKNDWNTNNLTPEAVIYELEDDIAIITLNRPKKYNAINQDLLDSLNEAIAKVRKNEQIRALVLTGAGRGFSSGADLGDFGKLTPEEGRTYITSAYIPLLRNLLTLKKPIIAAVNGIAAGVGASIALACDLRVMTKQSALLYAFINIGLGPDGGASWLLARQIGYSKALEIALEGKKIKGEACQKLGLTNKLVEEKDLLSEAKNWAHRMAKLPTVAVGITKEDMIYAMDHDLYNTIAYEAEKQVIAFNSQDLIEGVSAFMEKRTPKFIGR